MINLLQATAPAPQAGGGYSLFIMLGLMILVLYFFMWRPESKRRKQMAQFRAGLKKGDKIITAGGIYGVVKEIKETTLLIEVDGNVTLRIDKNMVVADTSDLQQQQQKYKSTETRELPFPITGRGVLHTIIRSSPEINSKTKPAGQNQKTENKRLKRRGTDSNTQKPWIPGTHGNTHADTSDAENIHLFVYLRTKFFRNGKEIHL